MKLKISLLVLALLLSGCLTPKVIVESPQCPDTPDHLFDLPMHHEWADWYLTEYDPFCEALRDASESDDN